MSKKELSKMNKEKIKIENSLKKQDTYGEVLISVKHLCKALRNLANKSMPYPINKKHTKELFTIENNLHSMLKELNDLSVESRLKLDSLTIQEDRE